MASRQTDSDRAKRGRARLRLLAGAALITAGFGSAARAEQAALNFDDMTAGGVSGRLVVAFDGAPPQDGRLSTTIYATPRGGAFVARGISGFEIDLDPGGAGAPLRVSDESLAKPSEKEAYAAISLTFENGQITGGAVRVGDGEGVEVDLATERSRLWVGRRTTIDGACADGCALVGAWSGAGAPTEELGPVQYEERPKPAVAALALVGALSGLLSFGFRRGRRRGEKFF